MKSPEPFENPEDFYPTPEPKLSTALLATAIMKLMKKNEWLEIYRDLSYG
jgi:hypothetical protein